MTVIKLVIESTLPDSPAGFQSISVEDSKPVQEAIDKICEARGVPVKPTYALLTNSNKVLLGEKPISKVISGDGEILQLFEMKKNPVLAFHQWLLMSGIGIFVALAGLLTIILLYSVFTTISVEYTMVINAGPMQTDMILYGWPGNKRNETGEVFQAGVCTAVGGLATLPSENFTFYFDECFEKLHDSIKSESKKNAEVIFGATENMRMLFETDRERASEIISDVKVYISSSKFRFKDHNIQILSGRVEAMGEWISANYLAQALLEKGLVNDTFGVMSLGDSSTQISLEVSEEPNSLNVFSLTLFGNKFSVFSESFICHGIVESLRRYRALLAIEQSETSSSVILSPCEPKYWSVSLPSLYFSSICTPNIELETSNVIINGTGNYSECQRVMSKLLDFTECKQSTMGHCIDPSLLPPEIKGRSYYASTKFASIIEKMGATSVSLLQHTKRYMRVVCDSNLDDELSDFKLKLSISNSQIEELCFESQYLYTLLSKVYGFSSELDWSLITFTTQVGPTTLDWSLGYAVNVTNEIRTGPSVPRLKWFPFAMLTILFIFFVFLSIAFTVQGFRVRINQHTYQKLL